jgi:hypothetical protein
MAPGINPVPPGQDAHTPHKWFTDQSKPPMLSIAPPDEEQYAVVAGNRREFLGHRFFIPSSMYSQDARARLRYYFLSDFPIWCSLIFATSQCRFGLEWNYIIKICLSQSRQDAKDSKPKSLSDYAFLCVFAALCEIRFFCL